MYSFTKKDVLYKACLVRNGFPIKELYWTSSVLANNVEKARMMHFTMGGFHGSKSYKKGVVFCVKDE